MKFNRQTFLYIALAIVAAGTAWFFLSGNSSGQEPPVSASAPTDPAVAQFLSLIDELGPIHFNTQLFSDPRFTSLVDIGTPITPEPVSRHDVFAPIGSP